MLLRRMLVALAGLTVALTGVPTGLTSPAVAVQVAAPSLVAPSTADQPGPPRLARGHRHATRPGRPHDVPPRRGARHRRAVDLRRAAQRRADPRRRRHYDAGDRHLQPGRLQRRRRGARRGRLHPALGADRLDDQPRPGLRDAARADLPPDDDAATTPATWCSGCSRTAPSTPAPSRSSCRTPPTATGRRTGWPARSGRSARGTPRSPAPPTPPTRTSRTSSSERLELSIGAVDRDVLDTYGQLVSVDGRPTPVVADRRRRRRQRGGRARPAAYVEAGGSDAARTALTQLADGIAHALRRDRAHLALRRGVPVGPVAVAVARLGLPDAGRPLPGVPGAGRPGRTSPRPSRTPRSSPRGC